MVSTMAETAAVSAPLLSVENLEVLYADVILALKGVNLQVAPGNTGLIAGQPGDPQTWGGTIKFSF